LKSHVNFAWLFFFLNKKMFCEYIKKCIFVQQTNILIVEKLKTIKVSSNQIRETKAFKALSKIQQKLTLNRSARIAIENGVNVSTNIGFVAWDKKTQARFVTRSIVEELIQTSL